MADRVNPWELPQFTATEADRLYDAVQAAENAAWRLAEALDWMAASGDAEARKRRTQARRLHRRIFALLEPAEVAFHENGGLDAPSSKERDSPI